MPLRRIILAFATLVLVVSSCVSQHNNDIDDIVKNLWGKKIVFPDNMQFEIDNILISLSHIHGHDFTIITYVDSSDCTSCSMRMGAWNNIVNNIKSINGIDIGFYMILASKKTPELTYAIKRDKFFNPICFDSLNVFLKANNLPDSRMSHTFLLDNNEQIVAVGNPAANPHINDLFLDIMNTDIESENLSNLAPISSQSIGIIALGDSISVNFRIMNSTCSSLSIKDIMPSCHCIKATLDFDSIYPNMDKYVTVSFVSDSVEGPFTRYVDIFFNEQPLPCRLTIHGFATAQQP